MGKILPILMLLVGVGAGIGAGIVLAPPPEDEAQAEGGAEGHEEDGHAEGEAADHGDAAGKPDDHGKTKAKAPKSGGASGDGNGEEASAPEYVKLNNQFVVPVVASGRVEALVVLTLTMETSAGARDAIMDIEPKLRDAFLQVLFDHSNMGGFQGAFTRSNNLDILRGALLEVAQREVGPGVHKVLINNIARQDV